jgi:hypothetical protein
MMNMRSTAVPAALLLVLVGCSSGSDPVTAKKLEARAHRSGTKLNNAISDSGSGGSLSYFGGPVVSNAHIYEISWTAAVPAALQTGLPGPTGFYQTITNSPYWAWLAQYNTVGLVGASDGLAGSNQTIGPGSFVEAIVITPTNHSTTISDVDIFEELLTQISMGVIPPLDLDSGGNVNTVYMVDFPSSISLSLGGTPLCSSGIYGYHETVQVTQGGIAYSVPFGVVPDVLSGACVVGGSQPPLEVSYMIHSHELAESVTDPQVDQAMSVDRPIAWYDFSDQFSAGTSGEIGDLCAFQLGSVDGFTVQKLWSNLDGACIDIPPACNGSVPLPFCTPCTSSSQCGGAKPVCETTAGSAFVGECVACSGSEVSGCSGGTPYCDTTTDACRACTASDCTAPTAICEVSGAATGTCVGCDGANSSTCTGATPVCDLTVFVCVGCVTAADCKGASMPTCDVATQTCRACTANSDCPGDVCVTDSSSSKAGQCVGCLKDSDCGGPNGDCDTATSTCTCTKNEQCSNPTPTCSSSTCVACKTAGDCAGNKGGPVCSNGSCKEPPGSEPTPSQDAGHIVLSLPDASPGSASSSSGGCSTARSSSASDLLSLFVPALAFFGVRARRRSRP